MKPEHVLAALDGAAGGVPKEGAVGGGTGMVCHGFKGGIGTASRKLPTQQGGYTVGVLVQCNYGVAPRPAHCRRAGRRGDPRSRRLHREQRSAAAERRASALRRGRWRRARTTPEQGSIIVVVATDAPLLPHQLKRIATRVSLGVGRQGGFGGNSSGDIFIAFSTANPRAWHNDSR